MGALLPIAAGAAVGFGAAKLVQSLKPPKPIVPPVATEALAPPTTADTTLAGEQARKARPRGREETFLTGDLIPSEEELRGKKRFLGGNR